VTGFGPRRAPSGGDVAVALTHRWNRLHVRGRAIYKARLRGCYVMRRFNLLDLLLVGAVVAALAYVGSFDFQRLRQRNGTASAPAAVEARP